MLLLVDMKVVFYKYACTAVANTLLTSNDGREELHTGIMDKSCFDIVPLPFID